MYYNSYSLPQYETVWTPDAFVKTTVMPVIKMLVINWLIIKAVKLVFSPPQIPARRSQDDPEAQKPSGCLT